MCLGLTTNKELIGNLTILLSEKCKPLYLTKLLKLLYLIDEESVKRSGSPITWLDYKIWQLGPVNEGVYYSKNDRENKLSDYIVFKKSNNGYIINPIVNFDNGEFSEYDLQVINYIIDKYGMLNSTQLIELTHREGGLWKTQKESNNITFSDKNRTSEVSINFKELIKDNDFLASQYDENTEMMNIKAFLS